MKKIYIALFALLAVGSTFTACTEEEPFATVTENDDPHILAPVFPDRTNGQLATFANISRDANLSIALTVTPKDYTTVTWFIDGQEVESGTDSDKEINRSLKAGTYNLKIEVETVKGKKTSREGLVVVNPLADDPQSKEVAFERIVSPGKTARLYGSNLQNVTAILLGGNTITDPTYVESDPLSTDGRRDVLLLRGSGHNLPNGWCLSPYGWLRADRSWYRGRIRNILR